MQRSTHGLFSCCCHTYNLCCCHTYNLWQNTIIHIIQPSFVIHGIFPKLKTNKGCRPHYLVAQRCEVYLIWYQMCEQRGLQIIGCEKSAMGVVGVLKCTATPLADTLHLPMQQLYRVVSAARPNDCCSRTSPRSYFGTRLTAVVHSTSEPAADIATTIGPPLQSGSVGV